MPKHLLPPPVVELWWFPSSLMCSLVFCHQNKPLSPPPRLPTWSCSLSCQWSSPAHDQLYILTASSPGHCVKNRHPSLVSVLYSFLLTLGLFPSPGARWDTRGFTSHHLSTSLLTAEDIALHQRSCRLSGGHQIIILSSSCYSLIKLPRSHQILPTQASLHHSPALNY